MRLSPSSLCEYRQFSSRPEYDEVELQATRDWFSRFDRSTIPAKIAQTSFSRSSGPGGQKTNKYSILAVFERDEIDNLLGRVPKQRPHGHYLL